MVDNPHGRGAAPLVPPIEPEKARQRREGELRARAEGLLETVFERTAATTAGDFFRALTRCLGEQLDVRHVHVSQVDQEDPRKLRMLAFWTDGGFGEELAYEYRGTPCENVFDKQLQQFESDLRDVYPGHPALEAWDAESYLGLPLFDGRGVALGVIALIDDQPMPTDPAVNRVLQIVAARAGAELERLRAEAQRRELEREEQLSQKRESLGLLAGGIAHDFNNLLVGILGNVELARADLPQSSPVHESLEQTSLAARRAAELAHQMLAYAGQSNLSLTHVDLSELIEGTSDELQAFSPKQIQLSFDLARPLPAIEGDPALIRQILIQLVTNAMEAIQACDESDGSVRVKTGVLSASEVDLTRLYLHEDFRAGDCVYFEVSDAGCGLPASDLPRIFDPYYTKKSASRGLGLAAVAGITRSHRGAVQVESQPGGRTTFRILLPKSSRQAPPCEPQRLRGTGSVLVVDDEELVLSLAETCLEKVGFKVLKAGGGLEALRVFEERADEIAAVLLDVTMPGMDGADTFQALRAIKPDLPVLLSSGYSAKETRQRFADLPLAAFIQKPYRPVDLQTRLIELLSSRDSRQG